MKNILILLLGILLISCSPEKKQEQTSAEIEMATDQATSNFDWLLGKWKRLNEVEGKETFENWDKVIPSKYAGIGFTIQNGDTVKREKMSLTKTNEVWKLAVEVLEEPEPTIFKMDSFGKSEFILVNDSIDFPNKIRYWKEGEKLKAVVSNAEIEIPFEFEKVF